MTFMHYAQIYAVSVPVFFAIDMLWLGLIATTFYQKHLGYLLGPVKWPVAIGFYLIFLVGLLIFAIAPAISANSLKTALVLGALFGFFTYATYDFTNWATVRDWPAIVVFVDILWGTILSASVASITYWIATTFILR
jgi:uncharacterized membrane protein